MTMFKTLRTTIQRQSRKLASVCGLSAVIAISAGTLIQAGETARVRTVQHPTAQPGAPVGTGSGLAPGSGGLRNYIESGQTYSDGDVVYEGPQGMYPPGSSDVLPADCGYGCPPSWTVTADALYLNRGTDSQTSLSSAFRMPDFEYDTAGRVSLGHRYDCLIGFEVAYFGPFEWTQSNQAVGAGFSTGFAPAGLNLSAFNTNAVSHQQVYNSRIQSYEFSQKWWGWDVISTSAGVKFIDLEEDFLFNSTNALAENGSLAVLTNNHLFGGQLGLDLSLPVGRFSTTTRLRGSMYANWMDTSTLITNAGAIQVNTEDDSVDFAALIEVGYNVSYYLTPRIAVRAGYDSMWLYGLALAPDQLVNQFFGSRNRIDVNGDVFFHGASAGVEVTW